MAHKLKAKCTNFANPPNTTQKIPKFLFFVCFPGIILENDPKSPKFSKFAAPQETTETINLVNFGGVGVGARAWIWRSVSAIDCIDLFLKGVRETFPTD